MSRLQTLKERIEKLMKYHQIEVLRILKKMPNVCLNENNNGTFVNLTEQNENVIIALENYITYVDEQQEDLSKLEDEKDRIQNTFFKDNKESSNIKLSTNEFTKEAV